MNRQVERIARAAGVLALMVALLLSLTRSMRPIAATARHRVHLLRIDARNADSAVAVARAVGALVVGNAMAGQSAPWPSLTVRLGVIPSLGVRAVLGGAASAGLSIRWWDSTGVRALALDASAVPMPQSLTLIAASVAAMSDSASTYALTVRDAGGVLDSVAGTAVPIRLRAAQLQGPVRALVQRNGETVVTAMVPAPLASAVRRVLFMGQPGWDAKFVVAALEESGWAVDGTLAVSPTARVRIGAPAALDTARYSAVVVLDSGVANARTLRRFVSQGGGAVIAGDAVRDPELASLRPVRMGADRAVVAGALLTDQPRRGLSAYALRAERGAIVLEREGLVAEVVVARRGVGRVLASGYRSTWRWRMEGREESVEAHRRWWNALVSAVAFTPPSAAGDTSRAGPVANWPGDAAPLADLIARVGAREVEGVVAVETSSRDGLPLWVLFAVAGAALVTEWALRRFRGAR